MSLTLIPTQAPLHRGYKRTAVGVIPEDWTIRSLLSCLRSAPNYGINAAAIPFDDTLPTYLRITDIGEDNQFRPSPRVSVRHPSVQTSFLNKGDLVLARTGASVGKSYLYNPNDGPLVFAGFLIRVSPNPGELEPDFLAYCVQSKRYWNWVTTVSVRSGQPGINGQEYGTLQLPLPGPAEQRAIATALSDVDALLGGLDRLIAKKRDLKQAAMQQLLTGQTRLPGFHGEWQMKRLGDAVDTDPENLGPDTRDDFAFKYIALEDVERGILRSHSEQVFAKAPSPCPAQAQTERYHRLNGPPKSAIAPPLQRLRWRLGVLHRILRCALSRSNCASSFRIQPNVHRWRNPTNRCTPSRGQIIQLSTAVTFDL